MMKYNACAGNQSQTKKWLEEIAQKSSIPMIHKLEYNFNQVTNKFCITFVIFSNMLSVELRNWHQFQTKKFLEKCPSLQSNSNLVANNPFLRSIAIADCITFFTLSEWSCNPVISMSLFLQSIVIFYVCCSHWSVGTECQLLTSHRSCSHLTRRLDNCSSILFVYIRTMTYKNLSLTGVDNLQTLPKAQLTQFQLTKVTCLGHMTSSNIFRISTKHQLQNLNKTSEYYV